MKRRTLSLVLAVAVTAASPAAPGILPAPAQTKPVLLSGGTVFTVSGPVLEQSDVLFVDGRIAQIGRQIAPPAGAEIIDVRGKCVYPGLIAAHTQLGLMEISSARQTIDIAEGGPINPNA